MKVVESKRKAKQDAKDVLFYDGSCPLCLREINLMRKYTNKKIDFLDIHAHRFDETHPSQELLLRRLHLRTTDGKWLVGLDANVHAWSYNSYGKILKVLRWPIIKVMVDFVYFKWADRRYTKRYDCDICSSGVNSSGVNQ